MLSQPPVESDYLSQREVRNLPIKSLLGRLMADCNNGWSMGSFGALAEFTHTEADSAEIQLGKTLRIATDKGALALELVPALKLIAYEVPIGRNDAWNHGIALCLPVEEAKMHQRSVLCELGSDDKSIFLENRADVLIDMGLSSPQTDFCVRTANTDVLAALRSHLGRGLFDHDNPLLHDMPRLSPHRVIFSALGRLEVYQNIPGPDEHSPLGPHTHVLPDLAKLRRAHNANIPIPSDWTLCASIHIAHPAKDMEGEDKAFQISQHHQFQALLSRFGFPELIDLKNRVIGAIKNNQAPEKLEAMVDTRYKRAVVKVTLRQLSCLEATAPGLDRWRACYDAQ